MSFSYLVLLTINVLLRGIFPEDSGVYGASPFNCVCQLFLICFVLLTVGMFFSVRQSSIPGLIRLPIWLATLASLLYIAFLVWLVVINFQAVV